MNNYSAAIVTFASVLPIAVWLERYQIQRVLGYLFTLSLASIQLSQFYLNHTSDGTDLFVCACCFQQLILLDLDVEYLRSCHCTDPDSVMSFCNRCVRTYVESLVTADQAIRPVCMATRQCQLDDRLVRERLSVNWLSSIGIKLFGHPETTMTFRLATRCGTVLLQIARLSDESEVL
jgi:hypothetical protein